MDLLELTLQEHIILLNKLGYSIDTNIDELKEYRRINIYRNDKVVGDIAYEEKNMYYLYRDDRIVGNRDLFEIRFNKRKEKNIRSMIHLRLHDYNLKFNGFNQLVSEDRPFIVITDRQNYRITKYLNNDELQIMSLKKDIPDNEIVDELRKPVKKLTYKIKGV